MNPKPELTSGASKTLFAFLKKMRTGNIQRSVIVISHQERILSIADEIIVLADGKVSKYGTKDEILPEIIGSDHVKGVCPKVEEGGNCDV